MDNKNKSKIGDLIKIIGENPELEVIFQVSADTYSEYYYSLGNILSIEVCDIWHHDDNYYLDDDIYEKMVEIINEECVDIPSLSDKEILELCQSRYELIQVDKKIIVTIGV